MAKKSKSRVGPSSNRGRSHAKPTGKRQQNKQATKRRILSAALALFESRGFERTTTKQIAKRARVAEGTVFNYFETKEDIALFFFEQEVDHAIDAVRKDKSLSNAPLEEKLFALLASQLEFLAPYERFIGAALVQALRPTSRLGFSVKAHALRARYLSFVQELIEESVSRNNLETSWIAPHAFWIFYLGMILYWLHDESPGKQNTLAFVDRSLRLGAAVLRKVTL